MTDGLKNGVGSDLVVKLLLLSGLVLCVVGAFLILLVNAVAGAIVVGCGLFDLATSALVPRMRDKQV